MYAGKLNTHEINYFVLFLYTCMYWYRVMHMSKIEIYKGKQLSNIDNCKINNSPIRNKYKIIGILVLNVFYSM